MFGTKLAYCLFCLSGLAYSAQSNTKPLTILLRFEHPASHVATKAMESEVQHLVASKFNVHFWTERDALPTTSGRLLVFRMNGYCSVNHSVKTQPAGLALASTSVSDGIVLPFGQIECDRIQGSLQRIDHVYGNDDQELFGQAMGRVMVHEIYHMLSGSLAHTDEGLTKVSLSAHELAARSGEMSRASLDAIGYAEAARSK